MRDFNTPRLYFFSAHTEINSKLKNREAHQELGAILEERGIPFREVEGCYLGILEPSYMVVGASHGPTVDRLARLFRQQTYLVVTENDRTAYLVKPGDTYHQHLGKFVAACTLEPSEDSWTLCDWVYYICDGSEGPDLPGGL